MWGSRKLQHSPPQFGLAELKFLGLFGACYSRVFSPTATEPRLCTYPSKQPSNRTKWLPNSARENLRVGLLLFTSDLGFVLTGDSVELAAPEEAAPVAVKKAVKKSPKVEKRKG